MTGDGGLDNVGAVEGVDTIDATDTVLYGVRLGIGRPEGPAKT